MIRRLLPLVLFVVILAPSLLRADPPTPPADPIYYGKMYEDVEIFRRILDSKLHPLYPMVTAYGVSSGMMGMGGGMMGMQGGMAGIGGGMGMMGMQGGMMGMSGVAWSQQALASLEGVYLKGQGVIYTATLSSLQLPAKTGKSETAKPVSEWESVRRQLHNEKEPPKKTEASKPPELSEVLLKVLAENGHHFSQLSENESLTVVTTVHDSSPSAPKSGEGSAKAKPQSPPAEEKDASAFSNSKARDLELLGDLHLKQGQNDEALKAFQKALELKQLDPKLSAALYRKLAQCYLELDRIGEARSALDRAAEVLKNMQEAASAQHKPAAAKSAAALPVKLIISAPKKLLDQVKEGKISFEEFRRQATVEMLKFDAKRR
jgi:tetratricopeptide (TPR) repeat protein